MKITTTHLRPWETPCMLLKEDIAIASIESSNASKPRWNSLSTTAKPQRICFGRSIVKMPWLGLPKRMKWTHHDSSFPFHAATDSLGLFVSSDERRPRQGTTSKVQSRFWPNQTESFLLLASHWPLSLRPFSSLVTAIFFHCSIEFQSREGAKEFSVLQNSKTRTQSLTYAFKTA